MTHAAHTGFAQMDVPFNSVSQTLIRLQPPPPTVFVRTEKTATAQPQASGPSARGSLAEGEERRVGRWPWCWAARCIAGGFTPPPSSRWAGPPRHLMSPVP